LLQIPVMFVNSKLFNQRRKPDGPPFFILPILLFLLCLKMAGTFGFQTTNKNKILIKGVITRVGLAKNSFIIRISGSFYGKIRLDTDLLSQGKKFLLFSIRPGDRITGIKDLNSGRMKLLKIQGEYISGELLFISRKKLIIAQGRQIYISPDAVFIRNGKEVQASEIRSGANVFLRIDPKTGQAGSVEVVDARQQAVKKKSGMPPVNDLKFDKRKGYRRGDTIGFEIRSNPNLRISFDISGVCSGVPMEEIKPGLYRGRYIFSRADARQTRIIVHFRKQNRQWIRLLPDIFDVAVKPPSIRVVSPDPSKRYKIAPPFLFAEFLSEGTLIEAESISVKIDSRPLFSGVLKNIDYVMAALPEDIKPGIHHVEVAVKDLAGNRSIKKWPFYTGKKKPPVKSGEFDEY